MSLRNKLFSVLTLAVAMVAFSVFTFAQDDKTTTTTTTTTTDKADKRMKRDGREFGKRKGGRDGFARRHGNRGGFGMMGVLRGVDLTDAQKAQLKSIREANKPDAAVMQEMRTIAKAKRDGTITADQQARLTALREQARAKGASIHQQIEGILTAEQKAKIEARKQEMKQRFEKRREQRLEKKAPVTTDKPITN